MEYAGLFFSAGAPAFIAACERSAWLAM